MGNSASTIGEGADNWAKVNLNYEKNDGTEYNKHDESFGFDVTHDESGSRAGDLSSHAPLTVDESISPSHIIMQESIINNFTPDNIDISRPPTSVGFLVSFMVDARGGAMRGCRHSGVRIIIPPRKAPMPMRITCRYLKKEKLIHPPPLMEGEACASRILEVGPSGAKFLGPVIIEVPHFASMRGREREIIILRSDDGENWKEHTLEASEEAVRDILNESFQGDSDLNALEPEFSSDRITRILTTDFPQYFAIITRIRQEVNAMGPEGGMVNSSVVPQVQAIFPAGALTKKIKVGLQVGKNKNGNESEDDNEDETKGRKRKSRLSSFGLGLKKRLGRGNKKAKPSASTTKDLTISSPITVLSTSNQLEESTKMELSEDENIVQTSSKSITTTTIAPSEPQIETKISSNHVSTPEPLVVTSDGANVSEPRCSTSTSAKSASSSDCKKKDKSRLRTNRTELSHASNCFAEFVRVTMPNLDLFARMI